VPKSKYVVVLTCLIWLSRCPLGATHAVTTTAPTIPLIAKLQADTATSRRTHLRTSASQGNGASRKTKIAPEDAEADEPTAAGLLGSERNTQSQEAASSLKTSDTSFQNSNTAPFLPDSTAQNAGRKGPEYPIHSTIQYNAKDTIFFNIKNKTIRLYGAGIIQHDTIKFEAEEIFLDLNNHTITAFSRNDEAGALERKAVLTKDNLEYFAESVSYNFESQRAIANKLFTKQGDGILRANKIKKDRATTFCADRATYTTCNLAKPHFHVDARRIKIIEDDKVASGPFNLHFDGVPTPLGFIFGIFYLPRRGAGIIPPKYGGCSKRGFCLENGGYYINFNDYADLALQGSIYSKGSTKFIAESKYKKRYRYAGNLSYERKIDLSPEEIGPIGKEKTWELEWNHNTENNRASSLSAEVRLKRTSSLEQNFSRDNNGQGSTSSSIRYTNQLVGFPYTLGVSLQHAQSLQTKIADATIPKTTLRTKNIYPFRKKGSATGNWYSGIYFQHNIEFSNRLCNKVGNDTLNFFETRDWPELWKNGRQGIRHIVPLQTDIKILSYWNLTPKLEWQERWYWEKINYKYDAENDNIVKEKVPGFARVYDYNFSAALKTTLYGTHFFGQNATVQAFRHELEPVVSFAYTPDFSGPEYGYWQTIKGAKKDGEKLNKFEEATYGAPSNQATAVLKITLNNRLDVKIKSNTDVKKRSKKIPILESFDWSTSYDFQQDQHQWGDIQFKTRTSLFDKLFNIDFASTFDPYLYKGTRLSGNRNKRKYTKSNELAWNHGQGLGYMKSASLSIDAKLPPRTNKGSLDQTGELENDLGIGGKEEKRDQGDPEKYVAFKIPWNLSIKYNWHYTCTTPGDEPEKTNSLGFEWRIDLTEKWRVVCNSAYDLAKREWVESATNIGIHRDLHCWEMDFNWNPLGDVQTYNFSIGLKAPLLKDLKYTRKYPS
jgi:LptD protein